MLDNKININLIIILIIVLVVLYFTMPSVKEDFCTYEDRQHDRCVYQHASDIGIADGKFIYVWNGGFPTRVDKKTNDQNERVWQTACKSDGRKDCDVHTKQSESASSAYKDFDKYFTCPDGKIGEGCAGAFDNYYQKSVGRIGELKSYADMGYSCDINIAGVNYKSPIPLKYSNGILTCASADGVNCLKRKDYDECKLRLNLVPGVDLSSYSDSKCTSDFKEFVNIPNLITNGNFESPVFAAGSSTYTPGNVTGWTFAGSAVLLNNSNGKNSWKYPTYVGGVQMVSLQKTGSISQSGIQLEAGKKYRLSFVATIRSYKKKANPVNITIIGPKSSDAPIFNKTFSPKSYDDWELVSYNDIEVKTTGPYTIKFSGQEPTQDYSTGIDNIVLSDDSLTNKNSDNIEYKVYIDKNTGGNDLLGTEVLGSVNECKVECSNIKDCAGFVYEPGVGQCWLKNKNMAPFKGNFGSDSRYDTYVKYSTTTCEGLEYPTIHQTKFSDGSIGKISLEDNIRNNIYKISCPQGKVGNLCKDIYNNLKDSEGKSLKTFGELGYKCNENIKSGFVLGKQDPQNIYYFGPQYYNEIPVIENVQGNELKDGFIANSPVDCAEECTSNKDCGGFVYGGKNNSSIGSFNKCWLKKSSFSTNPSLKLKEDEKKDYEGDIIDSIRKDIIGKINNPFDSSSGNKYNATAYIKPPLFDIVNNKRSQGNDLKNYASDDVNKCIDECTSNKDCGGIVYDKKGKKCWLKNSDFNEKTDLSSDNDYDTYIKKQNPDIILDNCSQRINFHPETILINDSCNAYTETKSLDKFNFKDQKVTGDLGSSDKPFYISNSSDIKEHTTADVKNNYCYQAFKEFNLFPTDNILAVKNKNLKQDLKTQISDTAKLNKLYLQYSSAFNDPDLSYTSNTDNIKTGINEVLKDYPLKAYCCNRRKKTDSATIRIPLDPTEDYSNSSIDVKKFGFNFRNLPVNSDDSQDVCPTEFSKGSSDCDTFMKFYCDTVIDYMQKQGIEPNKYLSQYAPECQCYAPNTPGTESLVNVPSVCYKAGCDSGTTTYLDPGSRDKDGNAVQCNIQICSQVLNVQGNTAGGGVNVDGNFNNQCSQNTGSSPTGGIAQPATSGTAQPTTSGTAQPTTSEIAQPATSGKSDPDTSDIDTSKSDKSSTEASSSAPIIIGSVLFAIVCLSVISVVLMAGRKKNKN